MSPIKTKLLKFLSYLDRSKSIWLRAILCFFISSIVLVFNSNEDNPKYDLRFNLRGTQDISKDIVIIDIKRGQWQDLLLGQSPTSDTYLPRNPNDSFFWNESLWNKLLPKLKEAKAVGVSFYFQNELSGLSFSKSENVIWAAKLDDEGRLIPSALDNRRLTKSGLINLQVDNDGTLRRFSSSAVVVPHMAIKLASSSNRNNARILPSLETRLINFRGSKNTFPKMSIKDFLEKPTQAEQFIKGKIVVIGSSDHPSHVFKTPMGELPRAEIIASLVDNILAERWIVQVHFWLSILILLAMTVVGTWLMVTYPNNFSLVFLFWIGVAITSLSLWAFDIFYIYVPLLAPYTVLISLYIVFLSFQLTVKNYQNWQLEQEKRIQFEAEQLKNNFISLISHDLKTPIAKIQAICDRVMVKSEDLDENLSGSLTALRKESVDLYRYIQSILQITRVESKDFKINKESTDINELIFDAVQKIQLLAKEKKIKIDLELEPMFLIEIDSNLIREVILNLVENSVKYTQEGGHITLKSFEEGERVVVSVNDNGPGIPEEEQGQIFDKFYRAQDQVMSTKGSGLGLYLVKYFIELHNGRVFLDSEPGEGTSIGFRLPI